MLTHDLDQLSRDSARELSLHDINLLKVILASGMRAISSTRSACVLQMVYIFISLFSFLFVAPGLYPNIAVADELNSVRRDSDQLFHTR
jgi:hypothetical protein